MQQLVQDMTTLEQTIMPLCEKMMSWSGKNIYEDFRELTQPMTTMVSLILNNKQVLSNCNVNVAEENVLGVLEKMTNALEVRDDIRLLDSIFCGYVPWLIDVREQIEIFLKNQGA